MRTRSLCLVAVFLLNGCGLIHFRGSVNGKPFGSQPTAAPAPAGYQPTAASPAAAPVASTAAAPPPAPAPATADSAPAQRPSPQAVAAMLALADGFEVFAANYEKQGNYTEALAAIGKTLSARRQLLGEGHAKTADAYHQAGRLYSKKGETDRAIPLLDSALSIRRKVLGNEHLDTSYSLHELGHLFSRKKEFRRAIAHFEEAVDIQEKKLGENSGNVAHGNYCIGMALRAIEDVDKVEKELNEEDALELFEAAWDVQKRLYGTNHEETADSAFAVGQSCLVLGEYQCSVVAYGESLAGRRAVLGEDDLDAAVSYFGLGVAYMKRRQKGDDALALSNVEAALARFKKHSEPAFAENAVKILQTLCKRYKPACKSAG